MVHPGLALSLRLTRAEGASDWGHAIQPCTSLTLHAAVGAQSILHDLHATELAMRVLKLPLRRQRQDPHPMTGKPQMDLAKDIGRRELFGQVYSFLHHCAAVETPTGGLVHNPKIQARTDLSPPQHRILLFMLHAALGRQTNPERVPCR